MAISHAASGQVISVSSMAPAAAHPVSTALFKSTQMEVIRMHIAKDKAIPTHRLAGEVSVQCLEGRVAFTAQGTTQELGTGQMLFLRGGEEHAMRGLEDSQVLVTIVL